MQTLKVDLGERSYPIHIGEGLLDQPELLAPHIAGRQVAIISNETVAPLYLERLTRSLAGFSVISVVLPDGEAFKTWETLQTIFDGLLTARHDRRTTVIALGGGVIGDMAGFAAACYQRGVDFIQVPTTLLSQVDSSVGGKTGINHPLGKNMVGAFYQPNVVLIDTATLNTLPARELSAGLAEVIKYGLICDEPFLTWLEENVDRLRALDQDALTYAIERSCAAKAAVVGADERETGVRAERISLVRDGSPVSFSGAVAEPLPLNLQGFCVLLYSGNFGVAHDVETVAEGYRLHHREGTGRVRLWLSATGAGADQY